MWQPDEVWCGYAFRGIAAPTTTDSDSFPYTPRSRVKCTRAARLPVLALVTKRETCLLQRS
jgi:hypothetical protein